MISILLPIYNGFQYFSECLESIQNQSYTEWELLIGINGHEENSVVYKMAKMYELEDKIKVFDFHTLKGKVDTLNALTKEAKYDYVAIIDVDDIWNAEKLLLQKDFLGEYDVIGSKCVYFGELNNIIPQIPFGDFTKFDFFSVNPIINSSVIIRKQYALWDKQHEWLEDYDLWLRLRYRSKCTFYNVNEVLVKHRIHSDSAFNSKGNHLHVNNLLEYWRKNI